MSFNQLRLVSLRLQYQAVRCHSCLTASSPAFLPSHHHPHTTGASTPHTLLRQTKRNSSHEKLAYFYSPDFPPVRLAQMILESVHDVTGLPWWGSILLTTVVLRSAITLPIYVFSQWNIGKLQQLGPILKGKSEELAREVAIAKKRFDWTEKDARLMFNKNMQRLIKEQYISHNCHPAKSFLVFWTQLPIWIGMSLALRNLSGTTPFGTIAMLNAVRPEMAEEGSLWFINLVTPDPTWLLPAFFSLTSLANVEVMNLTKPESTKIQRLITNAFRGVSIIMFPICIIMPSCMVYYWSCSTVYALTQTLVMLSPRVKAALSLPMMAHDTPTPYRQILHNARNRYFKRKSENGSEEEKS